MLRRRKGAERQRLETAVALERVEHVRERVVPIDVGRAVSADDQRRRRAEARDHVLQRLDGDVGSVQVFEQKHQRLAASDADERPRQEFKDLGPVLGLARERLGELRVRGRRVANVFDLRQHRKQRHEVGREVGEVR